MKKIMTMAEQHLQNEWCRGARDVLMSLKYQHLLKLCDDKNMAYTEAVYKLLMEDDDALIFFATVPNSSESDVIFYDHQRDKKGKVVSVKARKI